MKGSALRYFLIIFLLFPACGFKVVKQGELVNFKIAEINTKGDKRINFKIKNKLFSIASLEENKLVNISLVSIKTKSVKEKNIKNEVQKYQIDMKISVELKVIGNNFTRNFTVTDTQQYNVEKQHSITLRNEKKAIEISAEKLSKKILEQIIQNLNDI